MPQLVVNTNDRALNKVSSKLKVNSIKLRHAPYSDRCAQATMIIVITFGYNFWSLR
jgi:hypothetical protein